MGVTLTCMDSLTAAMCLFRVLLLVVLLYPGKGNSVWEEIFTRLGSDLLLPIRRHLTLNHPDTKRCDMIFWTYAKPGSGGTIAEHRNCKPSDRRYFPNIGISVNGSVIISNVTLRNDGRYWADIFNSTGNRITTDHYIVYVEGNGDQEEEIFTRLGSDLLLPIRRHLILNRTDRICDWISWSYKKSPGSWELVAKHWYCYLYDGRYFPNTRISENGSLIIPNVTPRNDGRYWMHIHVIGDIIQDYYYRVYVEVPVSIPVLHVSCLQNGSIRVTCRVEAGTKPNIHLSIIGESQGNYSTSANNITAIVKPPGPWNLTCTVENGVSRSEESRAGVTCPVPVSDPVLDMRCLQNGSAEISCEVKNGTDPSIYLTVSGELEVYNVTRSERTVRVTVPPVSPPDSWNIRCSAKNNISERSTNQKYDTCPVPVSIPVLHVLCLRNGSIRVTCRVEAGTKPNIHLSIIGESQGNYSTSANNITAIVKPPGPWNITCTVENGVSRSEESRAGVTCSVPVLHVICLRNGSIRVTCRVEAWTKPNIHLSIIGESQGNYSTSANNITAIVKPPGPWNITCTVENGVSQSEESRAGVTCPEESRCGMSV